MGYLAKVDLQREHQREVEKRHSRQRAAAKAAAAKYEDWRWDSSRPVPLNPGEESILRKALRAMNPLLWMSKKNREHEAAVKAIADREVREKAEKEKAGA